MNNILNKISVKISYILTFISVITLLIGLTGGVEFLETISSSLAIKNGIGIIFYFIYCIIGFINSIVFFIYIFTKYLLNEINIYNITQTKIMIFCLIINFVPLIMCIFSFLNLFYTGI